MSKFNFNNNSVGNGNENPRKKRGMLSNLKSSQKMLIAVVAVFVIMIVAYSAFISFTKNPNGTGANEIAEENISQELLKNKTFQGLELRDIEVETTSSLTHLMANITNTADEAFPAGMVDVVFLDASGKEMGRVPTYIDTVEAKGEIRIDTVIDKNYKTAHTFKVEAQQ